MFVGKESETRTHRMEPFDAAIVSFMDVSTSHKNTHKKTQSMVFALAWGKNVNLRIVEKEDLALAAEWLNNLDFFGEYTPLMQMPTADLQKMYDNLSPEEGWFFIEKKDGSKVGSIDHRPAGKAQEIGYAILPRERKKGYCSEAVSIIVDYQFLSKDIVRIQAHTNVRNIVSQKVLERTGFKKEGVVRKSSFVSGQWGDSCLYSILRRMERTKDTNKNREEVDSVCYQHIEL